MDSRPAHMNVYKSVCVLCACPGPCGRLRSVSGQPVSTHADDAHAELCGEWTVQ